MKGELPASFQPNLSHLQSKLRLAGLRPTRQRVIIGAALFGNGHRHVTAEQLHDEVDAVGANISLATVYNTLNQFAAAGIVRSVSLGASRRYFDTATTDHHHLYIEQEGRLVDLPDGLVISNLPVPPEGMEIANVDVVITVRPKR